jgi:RNA polymerase sigma-70 factor (ECF subfamily)
MAGRTQLETLFPELRAYARSISTHADMAEDLVQDAIERALRVSERPEKIRDLRPWMFRVIRNLHFDELRRLKIRREYLAREKRLSSETGGTNDVARDVLIRLAFERLHPDKREVLFLVDIIGLKYAEAAEVMGVPRGTVMSRLSRARYALREAIDGRAEEEPEMRNKAADP